RSRRRAVAERPQPAELLRAVARRLAEQQRRSERRGPEAVGSAEQGRQRLAELLRAERLGREERQLPAIECLGKLRVLVRDRDPLEQVGGELAAERVEPRGLPRRLRRGD